ncbi:MAG: hypothetical protein PXX73_02990 [Sideroxydans sp.]|nr:hypothetical protein [Sideroxydans sp.]
MRAELANTWGRDNSSLTLFLLGQHFPELFDAQSAGKRAAEKSSSLLTALRDMGGIANSSKGDVVGDRFAPGGYNQASDGVRLEFF